MAVGRTRFPKWIRAGGSLIVISILVFLLVRLVLAAFSGTKRRLGSESLFESVSVAGNMTLGDSGTDGWVRLKPTTSPPTCDSTTEGELYSNTTDHIVYLCNGTSWGSL